MASAQKMIAIGDDELVLNLEDAEQSELKSDLAPIIGTAKKSGYKVSVQRLLEVHGLFEPHRSAEASLLVLKFSPNAESIDRRLEAFSLTLAFEAAPGADPDDDPPYIVSYAPGQEGETYFSEHETTVTKTRSIEISGSAQPPVGGASLGLTASGSQQEESQRRDLYRLATESWRDPGLSEPNVVRWRMKAATKVEGIGDSIGVAVLLRRARSSKFSIRLEVEADLGFRAQVSEKMSKTFNALKKDKRARLGPFGPGKGVQSIPEGQSIPDGVDLNNLHDSSTKNILDKLAFVHVAEHVATKEYYSDAAPPSSALTPVPGHKAVDADASASPTQLPTTSTQLTDPVPEVKVAENIPASSDKTSADLPVQQTAKLVYPSHYAFMSSNSRAIRHRKMAALYQRLAQLHREEAEEAAAFEEAEYADDVERKEEML